MASRKQIGNTMTASFARTAGKDDTLSCCSGGHVCWSLIEGRMNSRMGSNITMDMDMDMHCVDLIFLLHDIRATDLSEH